MTNPTSLATPLDWWQELDSEFHFTVDLAADKGSGLCDEYYTEEDSAFDHEWKGVGWLSPPWDEAGLFDWVLRALMQTQKHNSTVVMLLPDRPESPWSALGEHAEVRGLDQLEFTPMRGDLDREIKVEPHSLWVFGGSNHQMKSNGSKDLHGESLEEIIDDINIAFREQYDRFEWSWVMETHFDEPHGSHTEDDDSYKQDPASGGYVIVNVAIDAGGDDYFRVGFTYSEDEGYGFDDIVQWVRLVRSVEWVEEAKARQKARRIAEFDLDACPKKMVKVLQDDGDTLHIGAYATIWGELDCEGERMTKEAIEPYVGLGAPLMFWIHGLTELGSEPVGSWDADSFVVDDTGLYVEGTVTHPEVVSKLREAGDIGLSVGSLFYMVQSEDAADGTTNLVNWPLLEISIMEGGKQCVPNALQDEVDKAIKATLEEHAAVMGVVESGVKVDYKRLQLQAKVISR